MSPGFLIACSTLAAFGGFGYWIAVTRQRVTGRRWKAGLLFGLGVALGAFAWWNDARFRRETLFEAIVDGSPGAVPGTPAVERQLAFDVLHPGVEHTLTVYPEYRVPTIWWSNFPAEVRVRLSDETGRLLLEGGHVHAPRAQDPQWRDQRYSFVPTSAGRHTLVLVLITPDIPAVHVRIVDPLGVPDDRRVPGY